MLQAPKTLSWFLQELTEGPWRQSNLDAGASMIITVPAPMGGAIVVGESVVAYIGHGQQMKCTEMTPTIVRVGTGPRMGVSMLSSPHPRQLMWRTTSPPR